MVENSIREAQNRMVEISFDYDTPNIIHLKTELATKQFICVIFDYLEDH